MQIDWAVVIYALIRLRSQNLANCSSHHSGRGEEATARDGCRTVVGFSWSGQDHLAKDGVAVPRKPLHRVEPQIVKASIHVRLGAHVKLSFGSLLGAATPGD